MQPKDKISKSSWTLLESIKDAVSMNVTNACRSGQLKIEATQVPVLLALIDSSASEGYHKAHRNFTKVVEAALDESTLSESMPSLKTKKK